MKRSKEFYKNEIKALKRSIAIQWCFGVAILGMSIYMFIIGNVSGGLSALQGVLLCLGFGGNFYFQKCRYEIDLDHFYGEEES